MVSTRHADVLAWTRVGTQGTCARSLLAHSQRNTCTWPVPDTLVVAFAIALALTCDLYLKPELDPRQPT